MQKQVDRKQYFYGWCLDRPAPNKENVWLYNSWAQGQLDRNSMAHGGFKMDFNQTVDDTVLINYPVPPMEKKEDEVPEPTPMDIEAPAELAPYDEKREYFLAETGITPEQWVAGVRPKDHWPKDDSSKDVSEDTITIFAQAILHN